MCNNDVPWWVVAACTCGLQDGEPLQIVLMKMAVYRIAATSSFSPRGIFHPCSCYDDVIVM